MVKFTGLQIVLLVLAITLIVYLIFTRKKKHSKKQDKKEDKKQEGTFDKLLKSQKEKQFIVPSKYEEGNNDQERIVGFPKQETNDIANEWIRKFVEDYCGKTITFKLPSKIKDLQKNVIDHGMFYTILNNKSKSIDEKKDDLAMVFVILPVLEREGKMNYKVIDDNTVELKDELAAALNSGKTITYKQFKDYVYSSFDMYHMNNEEGKQKFREGQKRFDNSKKIQDPTYIELTDQEIDDMYIRTHNMNKESAQVYCQNI